MSLRTTQQIAVTGLVPVYAAADAGGDTFTPDERTFAHVRNNGGSAITATVTIPGTTFGQNNPDVPVPIAAGASAMIGPLTAHMADPVTAVVEIEYTAVASVDVAALRI